MTVIPFPPRDEKPAPVVEAPPLEETLKSQSMAMMKAALREASNMGIAFPNDESTIKDSLLCMETIMALLLRIHGYEHVFHRMTDENFEAQPDGSYHFYPPIYRSDEETDNDTA